MEDKLIDMLPLWGLFLLTLAMVIAASECGFLLGARRARSPEFESEGQVSSLTGAHLGLLAFIMAFSFSLAADHSGKRKRLVLEEANVIETAYLKAGLISGSAARDIQAQLREYAEMRASVSEILATEGVAGVVTRSERHHARIYEQLQKIVADGDISEVDGQLVESIGALVTVHNDRITAGTRSRLPSVIWVALYSLLLLSMMGMGYYSGIQGKRSPLAHTALAVSFSTVMVLIADLDRPREGLLKPDQSLMSELSRRLAE